MKMDMDLLGCMPTKVLEEGRWNWSLLRKNSKKFIVQGRPDGVDDFNFKIYTKKQYYRHVVDFFDKGYWTFGTREEVKEFICGFAAGFDRGNYLALVTENITEDKNELSEGFDLAAATEIQKLGYLNGLYAAQCMFSQLETDLNLVLQE